MERFVIVDNPAPAMSGLRYTVAERMNLHADDVGTPYVPVAAFGDWGQARDWINAALAGEGR